MTLHPDVLTCGQDARVPREGRNTRILGEKSGGVQARESGAGPDGP